MLISMLICTLFVKIKYALFNIEIFSELETAQKLVSLAQA